MGDTYLVEIRLARTRWRIKELTRAITRRFGAGRYREPHPHVTLFGPFALADSVTEQDLLDAVAACAAHHSAIPFIVDEWEHREGMHGGVVAFSIRPSPTCVNLVAGLSHTLATITTSLNPWDRDPELKWFHATIANRLPLGKAGGMMEGLSRIRANRGSRHSRWARFSPVHELFFTLSVLTRRVLDLGEVSIRPVLLDDAGLRITVMHENEILGEYDLIRQCWLTAEEIRDPRSWQEGMARYRKATGFELFGPVLHPAGETFLISDLHLGHANITQYCSRPFVASDVAEMDRVLVNNWNYTVSPDDRVYFLGDLQYGSGARREKEYRSFLNGTVTYVRGNHDTNIPESVPSVKITCDGTEFLLVHDPEDAPAGYAGWVIHGHHHNNNLRAFPYIDPIARRINVSAEVIGYYPVSLREICRTLRDTVIPSGNPLLLRYPYVREDGTMAPGNLPDRK